MTKHTVGITADALATELSRPGMTPERLKKELAEDVARAEGIDPAQVEVDLTPKEPRNPPRPPGHKPYA